MERPVLRMTRAGLRDPDYAWPVALAALAVAVVPVLVVLLSGRDARTLVSDFVIMVWFVPTFFLLFWVWLVERDIVLVDEARGVLTVIRANFIGRRRAREISFADIDRATVVRRRVSLDEANENGKPLPYPVVRLKSDEVVPLYRELRQFSTRARSRRDIRQSRAVVRAVSTALARHRERLGIPTGGTADATKARRALWSRGVLIAARNVVRFEQREASKGPMFVVIFLAAVAVIGVPLLLFGFDNWSIWDWESLALLIALALVLLWPAKYYVTELDEPAQVVRASSTGLLGWKATRSIPFADIDTVEMSARERDGDENFFRRPRPYLRLKSGERLWLGPVYLDKGLDEPKESDYWTGFEIVDSIGAALARRRSTAGDASQAGTRSPRTPS